MNKILVANRGEIALRIMRTCREMGIDTVAVFSEADRTAPFVQYADEAVCIGPAPSSESYLKMDRIINVAKELQVDGIHPGYGFMSENSEFAKKVTDAGITFIGPSPESMDLMGSKLAAKAAVKKYDIPLVPGTDEPLTDVEEGKKIAAEIGFPVLIKASAGGGGKGMRIVESEADFEEGMNRAISEAESSFGDGRVFLEKFVGSPRHIEIQVMADVHGNVVYFFERECSIQRRHQKVIEEAPSAVVTPEMREEMGECAVKVAQSCHYVGAGTVEFLVDENLNFYFLEMNTRLQVEHPVTEMITGFDLVKEQIRVARREKLGYGQKDLLINGHAIEIRVYAEDPMSDFLPSTGALKRYKAPEGPGVRVDDGFREGMEVPIHYDPMISKLIVHAANRNDAIEKMTRAIDDYQIGGVDTTLAFCKYAINHESFKSGNFDTNFVKHHFQDPGVLRREDRDEAVVAALLAAMEFEKVKHKKSVETVASSPRWKSSRKTY